MSRVHFYKSRFSSCFCINAIKSSFCVSRQYIFMYILTAIFMCQSRTSIIMQFVDTGLWTFFWFVGFCYLTDKWRNSKVQNKGYGDSAAEAAIAFSFFSILSFVSRIKSSFKFSVVRPEMFLHHVCAYMYQICLQNIWDFAVHYIYFYCKLNVWYTNTVVHYDAVNVWTCPCHTYFASASAIDWHVMAPIGGAAK